MTKDKTLRLDRALDIASEVIANGGRIGEMAMARALIKLDQEHEMLVEAARALLSRDCEDDDAARDALREALRFAEERP